jgi:hypothetical protein
MLRYRLLIKSLSFTLLNSDSSPGALSEAGTETITVFLGNQLCLAVYNLERSFSAGQEASPTAVTLLFININYFPDCLCYHGIPPEIIP